MSAYTKDLLRTIRSSLGRFLAIFGIVALGAGFYGGLRMTCIDMKTSADQYYDATNLMDFRVVSTLGFSDSNIQTLKDIDGVEGVMPGKTTDVVATAHTEQNVVRLHSLNEKAYNQTVYNDYVVKTSYENYPKNNMLAYKQDNFEKDYINRPVLLEGNWPRKNNECVLLAETVTNEKIEIGDKISISECLSDLDSTLASKELTVTGFVRSSYYVCTSNLGTSTLGSGRLQQVAYVPDSVFNADLPFTEVYVTVKNAKDDFAGSEAYKEKIKSITDKIDSVSSQISADRTNEIKSVAQNKIDEAKSQYEDGKRQAEEEISSARSLLDESLAQLNSGQISYDEGVAKLEAGEKELYEKEISTYAQINEAKQQLNFYISLVSKGIVEFREFRSRLNTIWDGMNSKYVPNVTETYFKSFIDEINKVNDAFDYLIEFISASDLEPDMKKTAIEVAEICKEFSDTLSVSTQETLDKINAASTIQEKEIIRKSFVDSMTPLYTFFDIACRAIEEYSGYITGYLNEALNKVNQSEAEARAAFAKARKELEQGRIELFNAKTILDSGWEQYSSGVSQFASAELEANEKLARAYNQIKSGQLEIDKIEPAEIYVLDRTKNYGTVGYYSDSNRIDNIAQVFPLFFFLVAALVVLTTMTRMVEEDRVIIGTYKALGYSRFSITKKYLTYGTIASIVGSIVGILILSFVLPFVVMFAYSIIYHNPVVATPIDLPLAFLAGGLSTAITLIATIFAANKTLHENPASLMLPAAPKPGKRILLERVSFLWQRFSFAWKVSFRNMFRYKKRLFMTIIGIAGCTALLLTGFGLHDSINDIIANQFGYVTHDNFSITYASDISQENKEKLHNLIMSDSNGKKIDDYEEIYNENIILTPPGKNDATALISVCFDDKINKFRQFKSRTEDVYYRFSYDDFAVGKDNYWDGNTLVVNTGALVSEKVATLYNAKVGDTIRVSLQDKLGNASQDTYDIKIAGIIENYTGNYIYISSSFMKTYTDKPATSNQIIGYCSGDKEALQEFSKQVRMIDGVKTVVYNEETVSTYQKMLASVDMVVVVLIVFAALLAFIVLYNLTNINITERIRELATLRVLGFTKRETNTYIHRETFILSILGALFGFVLGNFLEYFVIISAEVDQVMFGRVIHWESYVYSFLITMGFTLIVVLFMRKKIGNIDMVESLKSID